MYTLAMRIALGSDHRGFPLKEHLAEILQQDGHTVLDLGTHSIEAADHPLFAIAVGEAVAGGEADLGIVICGSGLGVCIAANKVPGVMAAAAWNTDLARLARAHNGANVLCLGAEFLGPGYAELIARAFIAEPVDPLERYARRRAQIGAYESRERSGV